MDSMDALERQQMLLWQQQQLQQQQQQQQQQQLLLWQQQQQQQQHQKKSGVPQPFDLQKPQSQQDYRQSGLPQQISQLPHSARQSRDGPQQQGMQQYTAPQIHQANQQQHAVPQQQHAMPQHAYQQQHAHQQQQQQFSMPPQQQQSSNYRVGMQPLHDTHQQQTPRQKGVETMSLPPLLEKSSVLYGDPQDNGSKRIYPNHAYNPAYNDLFNHAAGHHTHEVRDQSSLKAYSDQEFNHLYDGMAGLEGGGQYRKHPNQLGPEAQRRRFPGGLGGQGVDELLRTSSKPLESEHPSVYEKMYTGAAGGASGLKPRHFLSRQQDEAYSSQAGMGPGLGAGAGPSRVDDIVLGHDIDNSGRLIERLKAVAANGAAGVQRIGASPRNETFPDMPERKRLPAMGTSAVDEVLFGHDIDNSSNPAHLQKKEAVFRGAAGNQSVGAHVRQEGRKHIGAGISQVDETVLGTDLDNSANFNYGRNDYAGRRCVGVPHRQEGRRQLPGVGSSQVDELVWGRDIDESAKAVEAQNRREEFQGAAGYKSVETHWDKGRRHAPVHLLSKVDELITGRDIDGSNQQLAALPPEQGFPAPAGCRAVGASPRQEGRRYHNTAAHSQADELIWGRDIDMSQADVENRFQQAEFQGAAGIQAVGAAPRPEGKRYVGAATASQVDEVVWQHDIDGSRDQLQARAADKAFVGAAGIQSVGAQAQYEGKRCIIAGQQSKMDELIWNTDIDRSNMQAPPQVGGAGCPSGNFRHGRNGLDIRLHDQANIPDRAYRPKNLLEIGRNNLESRSFPHIMSDDTQSRGIAHT